MRYVTMRKLNILMIGLILLVAGACQRNSTPGVAAGSVVIQGSMPPSPTAVGPIPGPAMNVTFATNPFANDPVALQEGRKLFNWYNCSGCHGGHAGCGMGPSLRDQVWLFGSRDDQIFDSIAEGRGEGMPAWGAKIPQEQIWKLVAYIKSMRTRREPEPPDGRARTGGATWHYSSQPSKGHWRKRNSMIRVWFLSSLLLLLWDVRGLSLRCIPMAQPPTGSPTCRG